MPIETIADTFQNFGGTFGQVTTVKGKTSVWAVHDGPAADGFPSANALIAHGMPFGHGDRRTIKGFEIAKLADSGKSKPNIVEGPSGRKYVEMHVDSKDLDEKSRFEAQVGNQRVQSQKNIANRNQQLGEGISINSELQDSIATEQLRAVAHQ